MTSRNAFLFPGQGSHLPGLFRDLADEHPLIGATLGVVDEVAAELGREQVSPMLLGPASASLRELVEHDPPSLHLAVFAASAVAFRLLTEDCGVRPDVLLGHSLGELVALTAAGALTLDDGARLVGRRDEALRAATAPGGGLVALGCGVRRAEHLLGALGERDVSVAADNGPGQVVLSGPDDGLRRLGESAKALGITATRLRIPYPFHNRVLAGAADDFAERAADLPKRVPSLRVYSSSLGRYVEGATDVELVVRGHLVRCVRFADAVRAIHADGARRFVESGPKGVLVDLVGGIVPGVATVAPFRRRTSRRALLSDLEELPEPRDDGTPAAGPRPAPATSTPPRTTPARRPTPPTSGPRCSPGESSRPGSGSGPRLWPP
ncbi:ACP S-malonyltransferase [Actinosynnema sp. NPDC053489]|uniref:ACP S-malonyltransferase n=1 Tax=Actinosynnema sp. NPDC053489 TaxID=3363916 RepID=UPI0037C6DF6D